VKAPQSEKPKTKGVNFMGLDKLSAFAASVVISAALAGNLQSFNRWVHLQTAKLLWESRSSAWGSPRFWPEGATYKISKVKNQKVVTRKSK
jgi:hypothetical protein